ncbi:hypothetical protein Q9L58_008341 [Maublancomyces gigas]|uniref:Uncharacterized protein n=1 Tax=Discina gigas TaxID=1032678 RepID=A0ABR3GAB6_9PEZI
MKLILALALPALAAAASSPTFASGAIVERGVLNSSQTQFVVANNSIFIGDAKYSSYSEPLILTYPGNQGSVVFTSFHKTVADFQSLLVYPYEARAVEFNTPRSAVFPIGATPFNFAITASVTADVTNNLLRYKDMDAWYACSTATTPEGTYQLFFVGTGVPVPDGCTRVDINTFANGACSA